MQIDLRNLIKLIYPEETKNNAYSVFSENQLAQLYRLIKYADYYDNNVFKYIEEDYPEYRASTQRKPSQVPLNYSRYIINKLADWQFEESIDIAVTAGKKADEKKAGRVEKDLYDIHKKNNMDLKLQQAAKECNTSGGVAFKMVYDRDVGIRFLPRPRLECFPITEFDDTEKINKVHFVAFRNENEIWKQTYELIGGRCQVSEAVYDVKNSLRMVEEIQAPAFLGDGNKFLDFIPVYIIPNNPCVGMVWGYSELEDLIPIIDELNRKYSDSSDALRFEMFAITIMLNVKDIKDAQDKGGKPKTKPGAVWNLFSAGTGDLKPDVSKLESQFAYGDTLKTHIDNLKNAMFELSSVIQVNPEIVSKLGNLSGVALKLMYASMISKTNNKNTVWKPKLAQMYHDSLKMRAVYESYGYPEDIDVEIITSMPVPLNEKEEVEIATMKLATGLSSMKREMDLMGIENPEILMAEILEERKQAEEAMPNPYNEGI
jgi:hypothetical protein